MIYPSCVSLKDFPYCLARDGCPDLERCRRLAHHEGDRRFHGAEEEIK